MVKEKIYAVVFIIMSMIVILFISNTQPTGQVVLEYEEKVLTETLEPIEEVKEENIIGKAVRLDECLQDCQYKICKKNCAENDGTLEPECFRKCLDECNNKCLKAYSWG